MMQREDHAVTVAEVKEIMDEAISHSQKANVKHLVKRVFGRNTDNSDHIILKEDDLNHKISTKNALPARSFVYADQTDNYKQRVLDILHKKCISCPKLFLFIAISSIIFLNIFDRR